MKIKPILIATLFTLSLSAQSSSKSDVSNYLKKLEVGIFGGFSGYSLRNSKSPSNAMELEEGGVAGFRLGAALTRRWSLEGAYTYGVNNLYLAPQAGNPALVPTRSGFGSRNNGFAVNPVWHFREADRRLRPFVTAGAGGTWFSLTDKARERFGQLGQLTLSPRTEPVFNLGGGVKYGIGRRANLRLDARNVWAKNPHFGLPSEPRGAGSYYIAPKGWQNGIQLTGGVGMNFGGADATPKVLNTSLVGDTSTMTIGQTRAFKFNVDAPAKAVVKTTWTLNGAPLEQAGDTYTFDSTGRPAGVYKICATATSKGLVTSTSCQEVTVVDPIKPTNTLAVAPEQPSILEGASTKVTAKSDLPANVPATYSWTINGQKQSETGSTLTFDSTGRAPGIYEVCSTVSAPNYTDKKSCTQIEVKGCGNPAVSLSAGPEINSGSSGKLTATPQTNACGSPVTVTLKASEGSIAPDGTFDSTGVAFDKTTPGIQRKTVTITANATDTKGRTASATSTVTVKFIPSAQRLDDIVFAAGSSRVNNCGKRLLLEVLSDKLKNDPNAQVILIGHMDKSEKIVARRGRKVVATPVDRRRVLNVAAVLSAGTGICPSMDLSRVKVGYAGTDDTSAPMLDFCGTSTVVKGGKPDARIGYRRVEVWFVPGGANMPASSVTIQDPPAAAVKALGCPR